MNEKISHEKSYNERALSKRVNPHVMHLPGMDHPHALASSYKAYVANFYHVSNCDNFDLLKVQAYAQTTDFTCGPASAMALMHYYGLLSAVDMNVQTEMRIAHEMGTSEEKGTSPVQIATWLEKNGLSVELGENGSLAMLRHNLKKGIPTLVEWMDWGGHWAIATGYDRPNLMQPMQDTIFLADANAHQNNQKNVNGIIPFNAERFNAMWFDAQYFKPGTIVKGLYITATLPR